MWIAIMIFSLVMIYKMAVILINIVQEKAEFAPADMIATVICGTAMIGPWLLLFGFSAVMFYANWFVGRPSPPKICPKCGGTSFREGEAPVSHAKHAAYGWAEVSYICKNCGHGICGGIRESARF